MSQPELCEPCSWSARVGDQVWTVTVRHYGPRCSTCGCEAPTGACRRGCPIRDSLSGFTPAGYFWNGFHYFKGGSDGD